MPRGDRSLVAPAIVGLTVFAWGAGIYTGSLGPQYPSGYPNYHDSTEQSDRAAAPAAIGKSVQSKKEKTPCGNAYSRDESNLCADWRAAEAAEDASRYAFWQLFASIVGVIGLVVTLWFNKQAWRQGGDALAHARSVSALELRPWLDCNLTAAEAIMMDGRMMVFATVCIENVGKSVARHVNTTFLIDNINYSATTKRGILIVTNHGPTQKIDDFLSGIAAIDDRNDALIPGAKITYTQEVFFTKQDWIIDEVLPNGSQILPQIYFRCDYSGVHGDGMTSKGYGLKSSLNDDLDPHGIHLGHLFLRQNLALKIIPYGELRIT